jgi:hypothetical protein
MCELKPEFCKHRETGRGCEKVKHTAEFSEKKETKLFLFSKLKRYVNMNKNLACMIIITCTNLTKLETLKNMCLK